MTASEFREMLAEEDVTPEFPFPRTTYEARIDNVRDRMAAQSIDLLLVSNTANWNYLTGYDSTMPSSYGVGVVPLEGDLWLHTAGLEVSCSVYTSIVEETIPYEWHASGGTAEQLAELLLERGYNGANIGVEMGYPETFASGAYDAKSYLVLEEKLSESTFTDATHMVLEERLLKDEPELEYMRRAGEISWKGLKASLETVEEGITDQEIVAAGFEALMSEGSELTSIDPMCMVGERGGYGPHMPFKRTAMEEGDTVYLEYTGTYNRYNAPSMRSAVVGEPSPLIRDVADAAIEALEILLDTIEPGRTGDDIAQQSKQALEPVSDDIWFHGAFGYSIGMQMQPTWTEAHTYIAEGAERELEAGMCFHLPIVIIIPHRQAIGFSESIHVTQNGCEVLTPGKERELKIV